MAPASMPSAPGRTSWSLNAAEFHKVGAIGGSLAHRFDVPVPLAVTAGWSVSHASASVRVGLQGEF